MVRAKKVKIIGRLNNRNSHRSTMTIDAFLLMVSLFILAVFIFSSAKPDVVYERNDSFETNNEINNNIVKDIDDVEDIGKEELIVEEMKFEKTRQSLNEIFSDGKLSGDEENFLVTLSCEDLKRIYETDKSLCLYLKDEEGNPLPLSSKKMGVGCNGVAINGYQCGDYI